MEIFKHPAVGKIGPQQLAAAWILIGRHGPRRIALMQKSVHVVLTGCIPRCDQMVFQRAGEVPGKAAKGVGLRLTDAVYILIRLDDGSFFRHGGESARGIIVIDVVCGDAVDGLGL